MSATKEKNIQAMEIPEESKEPEKKALTEKKQEAQTSGKKKIKIKLRKKKTTKSKKGEASEAGEIPNLPALPESEFATPAVLDPLQQYLKEISKFPLLTREEEERLTKEYYKTRDPRIAYRLVTSNLRLVVKIALDFLLFNNNY
jgi:RNA polymerase sigma-32 factor